MKHLRRDDPQYDWFAKAELSDDAHHELKAECAAAGVKFLTTIFNAADVPLVRSVTDTVKIGSGEAIERSVVEAVHGAFPRIFVSMGLCDYWSVDRVWRGGSHGVRFFHCVSRYPHPAIFAHHDYNDLTIGYSDHSAGLEGCHIAIVDGARVIEKHVCLPNQARSVQPWEASVDEFKALRKFADDDPTRFLGRWQAA